MKKIFSVICAVTAISVALTVAGCMPNSADIGESGAVLRDTEVFPAVSAEYEEESKAAISRWQAAGGSSADVSITAQVAAELYAYACYNELYIDKYVYFSDQSGSTSISMGSSTVTKQDYKLIIHGDEANPGYKYHYTIKNVDEIDGPISAFQSLFEGGTRLRFVRDGKLYGFNGSNRRYIEAEDQLQDILTCDWEIDTSRWGTEDTFQPKRAERLDLAGIKADIVALAQATADGTDEPVIHSNINILADGIVKNATITPMSVDGGKHVLYTVRMDIDTAVANADVASMQMLRSANSSDDCVWLGTEEGGSGLSIFYQIWDNGLFKLYGLRETWKGTTYTFSGDATSDLSVQYSYSDYDTDMSQKNSRLDAILRENPV